MNSASLAAASSSVDDPSQLLAVCSLNDKSLCVEKVVAQFHARGEQIVTKEGRMVGIKKQLLRDALEQASTHPDKHSYKFWYQKDGSARYCVKRIGSGVSCSVYLFVDLVEHKAGAFKKPRKKDPNSEVALRQEFDILQELNAEGVIWGIQQRPIECLTICRKSRKTSEYKQRRGVLHPLYQGPKSDGAGCDYVDHLNARGGDPLDVTLLRVHQLLHALQFLHERNYLHGDIKLENVLLEKLWTHLPILQQRSLLQ